MDKEKENIKKINKKLYKNHLSKVNWNWIIKIVLISFIISLFMSFISNTLIPNISILFGILVTLIFIFIGIIFDIIGVAVTSSKESVFHSMSARGVKGAKLAVKFKKNSEKVSSFCCDVIGDICGIVSGAAGTAIALSLSSILNINLITTSIFVAAIIASITIGGKAIGKSFAINNSNIILYEFVKIISIFYK